MNNQKRAGLTFSFLWHLVVFHRLFGPLRSCKKSSQVRLLAIMVVNIRHSERLICLNVQLFLQASWNIVVAVCSLGFFLFTMNLLWFGQFCLPIVVTNSDRNGRPTASQRQVYSQQSNLRPVTDQLMPLYVR